MNAPEPHWLPFRIGRYHFLQGEYAGTGPVWRRRVRAAILDWFEVRKGGRWFAEAEQRAAAQTIVQFRSQSGLSFSVLMGDEESLDAALEWEAAHVPARLSCELHAFRGVHLCEDRDEQFARNFLADLDVVFELKGLRAATASGAARIHGRIGSPFAPFTAISSDQWQHVDSVDWLGTGEAPSGERVYSIYIEPAEPAEPARQSLSSHEKNAERLIRSMMADGKSRPVIEERCRAAFPDLGVRARKRAWSEAARVYPKYSAPGRPRKSNQNAS